MATNDVAGERVYHVSNILREFWVIILCLIFVH